MENTAESVSTQAEDFSHADDIKFDPSDYLPRRTSRASAHVASNAIKKSMTEEKVSPRKLVEASSESETTGKRRPVGCNESKNSGKTKTTKFTKHYQSPYDCFVKLVRCENDPVLKNVVKRLKTQMIAGSAATGDRNSKYQVVYAPTCVSEKKGLSQITANGVTLLQKTTGKASIAAYIKKDSDSHHKVVPSGSARPGHHAGKSNTGSSLNVVVVHPKPGSKIVNAGKGGESKSALLQRMIADPKMAISNKVSRVMTTGGNVELACNKCSKTFALARDLINHKRMAHNTSCFMCMACARDFPTQAEHDSHACKAKFRCDICGVCCKRAGHLAMHKKMSHGKTLGDYMCYVCCFNAMTQKELDDHCCGGKPKIVYSAQASSSSVMVYPKWNPGPVAPGVKAQPNIYVNLAAPQADEDMPVDVDASPSSKQYVCEVCLNMYPTSDALDTHTCGSAAVMDPGPLSSSVMESGVRGAAVMDPGLLGVAAPTAGGAVGTVSQASRPQPVMPLGMEVLPEVAELAKFYSSVVFGK